MVLLSGDGALEAAPAMGSSDIILDLVSTGVTLRENNLKQVEGGRIMESEGALVANRRYNFQMFPCFVCILITKLLFVHDGGLLHISSSVNLYIEFVRLR